MGYEMGSEMENFNTTWVLWKIHFLRGCGGIHEKTNI